MVGRGKGPEVGCFFKVMFGKNIHKHLHLPPLFVRTMGHFDGQETEIEDSSEVRWPVKLSRVKGCLAFVKGWEKFFGDHSLKIGHFLVFTYTKGSHFLVQIFRESGCHFDDISPHRRSNRLRINHDAINVNSKDNLVQTNDVTTMEKPSPYGKEFWNSEKVIYVEDEDPCLMINGRDDCRYEGVGKNILYDLSCFEMKKTMPVPDSFRGVTQTAETDGNTYCVDESEKTLVTEKDAEKLDKAPECSAAPSHYVQMSQMKMSSSHENQNINGDSGRKLADKLEINEPDVQMGQMKMALSRENQKINGDSGRKLADKLVKASQEKIDQTKMAKIQSKKVNGCSRDIFTGKFAAKPSDNSNSSKTVKNERRESALKRRAPESSACSSQPKKPFGRPAVKNELDINDRSIPDVYYGRGKKPIIATEDGTLYLQPVKTEPDLPYDAVPSRFLSPFSVEVESLSYLRLPVGIPLAPGRKSGGRGRIVYLRGPTGKLCFVLYVETCGIKALTYNWNRFCSDSSIMPGDECSFEPENGKICAYRVEVTRSCRDSEVPQ